MNKKSGKNTGKRVREKEVEYISLDAEAFDDEDENVEDYERFEAAHLKKRAPVKKSTPNASEKTAKTEKAEKTEKTVTVKKPVQKPIQKPVQKPVQKKAAVQRQRTTGKRRSGSSKMSVLDKIIATTGVLITTVAVVTCTLYVNAKTLDQQTASFQELGSELDGIYVIGESGLLAVADGHSVRMEAMLASQEEQEPAKDYDEKELETKKVEVDLHLSSMQKDLKIKFINKETKKLIPNVKFEVEITDAKGKSHTLVDEDMDGVIYQADMTAGKCTVAMAAVEETRYIIKKDPVEVSIKDKIEYKKVDVADEVKKESEINASKEDTKKQETVVESVLTDTVGWVDSSKTPMDGTGNEQGYEEVGKDKITDPATFAASRGFMKLAAVTEPPADPNQAAQPPADNGQIAQPPADNGQTTQPPADNGQATPPPVETPITVSLNQTSIAMKPGETVLLTAVTAPQGNAVTFSSSDASIAAVGADGVITAYKAGTVTVTAATSTGATAACSVTVAEVQKPTITIDQTSVTVMAGKTVKLNAQVNGTTDTSVTWTVDNSAIASVAGDGTVTGISPGTATVKAASNQDPAITVSCGITVKANPEKDTVNKLKDNDGNQLYVKQSDGSYREAVYADYYTAEKLYKQVKKEEATYKYTGWQTIDGKTYYFDANGNKVTGEQIIQGAKYNFGSEGALSTSSGNMGIDVSKWNGSIDWNAVKNAGVSYVIIRCGYRGSSTGALIEDPTFRSNIKGASAAGLKVGVYFFTQAMNEVEAVEEASMVLQMISGYNISYPVFLDVEPSGGRGDGISTEARTAVCQAFCQTIQNSGYKAGIYANKTWFSSKINTGSLTGYKIWLAQYAAAPTYTATKYDMWQYSSTGKIAGIKGNVDLNISYLGY